MRKYPPGFNDGHVPLKEIPRRRKNGKAACEFPSRKYVGKGSIRVTSPLVVDLLMHIEADPEVVRISSFPVEVTYERYDRYGPIGKEEHIPEIGALFRDGSVVFMDAHGDADLELMPWLIDRGDRLNEVLVKSHGASFIIKDETELHQQPGFWNLRQIFRHISFKDKRVIDAVRRAAQSSIVPVTIGTLTSEVAGALDPGYPTSDQVYYAAMALCRLGEIHLDFGEYFSADTRVWIPDHDNMERI